MKKLFLILISCVLAFSLCSCNSETKDMQKTDEYALPFLEAMLVRDESEMKLYIHPDFVNEAMPDDAFYEAFHVSEGNYAFGETISYLEATAKSYVEGSEIEGKIIYCEYRIMSNELYFDVELKFLENDNGYGIMEFFMALSEITPELYPDINIPQ